jgi:hypothetical protein
MAAADGGGENTTLGDGTDPSNSTVEPDGTTKQYLDQFTFVASSGTDSVTALTVTTANTTAIASVEIWNEAMTTQYFSTMSSPSGNDWSFSGGTAIPVTTTSTPFRIRFVAKAHASLAAGTYAVTGTVTSFTSTNSQAGTDTDSATITVDNSPPSDATWGTIASGDQQIQLNWTNPGSDFNKVVILRRVGSAVGDAPTEGTEYNVNDTIGSSTVRYVGSLETFTDTGLTNGTDYYYKIFAYDDYINYASGAGTGPHTPVAATALCAFNFLDNPVDLTPSSTSWQDVDVSSWVPSGATGVILQAVNTHSSEPRDFLVRKKVASSPDAYVDEEIEAISHAWPMVGLDSNSTFQVYTEDSTYIKLYLVGYTGNGVAFFDNRVDKTPATADSWQDVNISADTGGDTAIAAIVGGFGASGLSYNFGLRKPAATPDDRYGTIDGDHQTWGTGPLMATTRPGVWLGWTAARYTRSTTDI